MRGKQTCSDRPCMYALNARYEAFTGKCVACVPTRDELGSRARSQGMSTATQRSRDLAQLRADTPGLQHRIHFNNAGAVASRERRGPDRRDAAPMHMAWCCEEATHEYDKD